MDTQPSTGKSNGQKKPRGPGKAPKGPAESKISPVGKSPETAAVAPTPPPVPEPPIVAPAAPPPSFDFDSAHKGWIPFTEEIPLFYNPKTCGAFPVSGWPLMVDPVGSATHGRLALLFQTDRPTRAQKSDGSIVDVPPGSQIVVPVVADFSSIYGSLNMLCKDEFAEKPCTLHVVFRGKSPGTDALEVFVEPETGPAAWNGCALYALKDVAEAGKKILLAWDEAQKAKAPKAAPTANTEKAS